MKKIETIEKMLERVNVKHPELPEARAAALQRALGSRKLSQVVGEIFPEDDGAALRRFYSYLKEKNRICVSLHHCVLLEKHFQLPEGSIYLCVFHTEKKNYRILKREYKLLAKPREIGRDDPVEPPAGSPEANSLAVERLRSVQSAASAKGLTNASKISRAVYPSNKKKQKALAQRLGRSFRGERMLTEEDMHEISSVLDVPPSQLIVRKDGGPLPDSPRQNVQPASSNGRPTGQGLSLSVELELLGVTKSMDLTSFDGTTRTFSSPDGKGHVKIRRSGETYSVEVTASAEIPQDRLGRLLEIILPKE